MELGSYCLCIKQLEISAFRYFWKPVSWFIFESFLLQYNHSVHYFTIYIFCHFIVSPVRPKKSPNINLTKLSFFFDFTVFVMSQQWHIYQVLRCYFSINKDHSFPNNILVAHGKLLNHARTLISVLYSMSNFILHLESSILLIVSLFLYNILEYQCFKWNQLQKT